MHPLNIQTIALAACLWVTAARVVYAQAPAAAPAPATPGEAAPSEAKGRVNLFNEFANNTGVLIGGAASLLVSVAGLVVAVRRIYEEHAKLLTARQELQKIQGDLDKTRQELDTTRDDLDKERQFFGGDILKTEPLALTAERKGIDYQIVLLGEGNTGKTTFVRMLSHNPKADLLAKTGQSQTFGFSLTSYEPGNWESIRFLVDDYRGQAPGEIAASPSLRGVTSENPRHGAAIFMLDICKTEVGTGVISPDTKLNQAGIFSPARLKGHVNDWNSKGLSNLQAHLRGRVRFNYVCCFINKIDLATKWSVAEEEAIKKELKDLFDEIQSHPLFNTGCFFEVIFGTLAVNEKLDGPKRRDRMSVGCNLPLLWSRLVERARLAALPGAPQPG